MTQCFIINAYGRSNRGDAVLLDECISEIVAVIPHAFISVALFEGKMKADGCHSEIECTERIGNASGPARHLISMIRLGAAFLSLWTPWLRTQLILPLDQKRTVQRIRDADLVISAPGGYIHDTNYAYYIALFHIYLAFLAGKTVILAPQSIGPITGYIGRAVTKHVLSRVSYICTRESYSRDFLLDLGLDHRTLLRTGDSAFWNANVTNDETVLDAALETVGLHGLDRVIGFTCVGWSFPHHPDPKAAFEVYVSFMARLADYAYTTHGLTPFIFNQVSDDIPTAIQIQRRATSPVHIDTVCREPHVLRAMIARCTVFIGTRFHSCIFALYAGRPTFAISYLPKTEYIMNDLGLGTRHMPIDSLDFERAVSVLDADITNIKQVEAAVEQAVDLYRSEYARLSSVIRKAISERHS